MRVDARTPVIVGAAQFSRRADPLEEASEPAEMMDEALRRAEVDTSARGLLARTDSIRVVGCVSWGYGDPGAVVAERLGARPRETLTTTSGGNSPQMLVNHTCRGIQRGELGVTLIAGAEAVHTRRRARRKGVRLPWSDRRDDPRPSVLGDSRDARHPGEVERGPDVPLDHYPLFEQALRGRRRASRDQHLTRVAELWSRFSRVAARNPHAWTRTAFSSEELLSDAHGNRLVALPYRKLMTANIDTDQAAALVLCPAGLADELGVPRDRWVFPHSGVDANDHWFVSERPELDASPAIRIGGAAALALAGVATVDLEHVDLYSCFPSAVQIAARELGLPLDRDLTVTGGLSFAGGPANNYTTHSIASTVELLRERPEATALCTAIGWYCTVHAFGVYSGTPPAGGFRSSNPQDRIDALPSIRLDREHTGPVTVESYTVRYSRDERAEVGLVACRTPAGARAWGASRDPTTLAALETEDLLGADAHLEPDGLVRLG